MEYQLQCSSRTSYTLNNCVLTSKYFNIPIRNYHFDRLIEADAEHPNRRMLEREVVSQVYLKVNSGKLFFLNIYPMGFENTSLVVSNLNHFIAYDTSGSYKVIEPRYTLEQILIAIVTKCAFLFSVFLILFGNKEVDA